MICRESRGARADVVQLAGSTARRDCGYLPGVDHGYDDRTTAAKHNRRVILDMENVKMALLVVENYHIQIIIVLPISWKRL